mgnify:CR=1 FL=1
MNLICLSVEDILHVLILFCMESLESDAILLYSERHALLRVLPVLVVLAMSTEKDGDAIFKKIKVVRLINIFKVIYLLSYTLLESAEWLYVYPLPNSWRMSSSGSSTPIMFIFVCSQSWGNISRFYSSLSCIGHFRLLRAAIKIFHFSIHLHVEHVSWDNLLWNSAEGSCCTCLPRSSSCSS